MRLFEFNEIDLQKMSVEELMILANQQLDEMIETADTMIDAKSREENNQFTS
jgi:hypothetical protein